LVPTVVPCNIVTSALGVAIFPIAAAIACEGSAGVEKTFNIRNRFLSSQRQSVNVPPLSIAMRNCWCEVRSMRSQGRTVDCNILTGPTRSRSGAHRCRSTVFSADDYELQTDLLQSSTKSVESVLISGKVFARRRHALTKRRSSPFACRRLPGLQFMLSSCFTSAFFLLSEGVLNGENQCHCKWDHAPE
jgi:hypothetical protein